MCQAVLAESVCLSSDSFQDVCCPGDILRSNTSGNIKNRAVRNLNLPIQV